MATALLERQEIKSLEIQTSADSENAPPEYHWTADALYRALEVGVFEHPERLELIQGRIIENMSQSAPHTFLRRRFGRLLRERVGPPFLVMEETPVRLALDGEPVPDVLVSIGTEDDYEQRHPAQTETVLVIEVSNTTTVYDLGGKARLYAQAGIADYWVVLVNEAVIVVHRQPSAEGYQSVIRLSGADTLSLFALPEAAWTVGELLGRTHAP